jgi:hypothetical protein
VRAVPILDEVVRFNMTASGEKEIVRIRPAQVDMTAYTVNERGHSPGFLIYFNHLLYRDYEIRAESKT